jgi:hypothetical protein
LQGKPSTGKAIKSFELLDQAANVRPSKDDASFAKSKGISNQVEDDVALS